MPKVTASPNAPPDDHPPVTRRTGGLPTPRQAPGVRASHPGRRSGFLKGR